VVSGKSFSPSYDQYLYNQVVEGCGKYHLSYQVMVSIVGVPVLFPSTDATRSAAAVGLGPAACQGGAGLAFSFVSSNAKYQAYLLYLVGLVCSINTPKS
jgi:hypothetical protein